MRALIVEDGFQRGALAAARALGRAGWGVGIAAPTKGFAAGSRFVDRTHRVPRPEDEEFPAAVAEAVSDGGYDVVFGAGDAEVVALSAAREILGAVFPYAAHEDVVRAFDKSGLAEAAARAGIAVPGEATAVDAPVVVKPRHTTVKTDEAVLRLRAEVAFTPEEAHRRIDYLSSVGADPVVQEYVEGDLVALVALADRESRIVASVQQRADLLAPRHAGGSVRAESVPVDQALLDAVGRLLAELNWFGLAQAQFMSPPGGEPRLIDLNGRFYGSLALAVAAGPNLPAMWAALAIGAPAPNPVATRMGVRYQWLEADLRQALAERRDLRSGLVYAARANHGLWDRRDPLPALSHLGRLAGRLVRKTAASGRARPTQASPASPGPGQPSRRRGRRSRTDT